METDDQKTFLDRIAETCETSKHIREAAAVARERAREIKQRAIQMRTDAEKMRKRRWREKNAHDRSPS